MYVFNKTNVIIVNFFTKLKFHFKARSLNLNFGEQITFFKYSLYNYVNA